MALVGSLAAGMLLALALVLFPYVFLLGTTPFISARTSLIPVGDSLQLGAHQSRRYGNSLYGGTVTLSQENYPGPLRRLFRWQVTAAAEGRAGAARVNGHGRLIGLQPGRVRVSVSAFGRTGSRNFEIIPRVAAYGVRPPQLALRVNEQTRLAFVARLAGGARPAEWQPVLWFPDPAGPPGGRYGGSDFADAQTGGYFARHADEWWFDVRGRKPGRTTIFIRIGPRELAVPLTVLPDTFTPDLHASGFAKELLSRNDYPWRQHDAPFGHVHVLPGSHAAQNAARFIAQADSSRRRAVSWLAARDDDPIEVFVVESRAQMEALTGRATDGVVRSGERTVVFLHHDQFQPFLVRDLVQLYSLYHWSAPPAGRWVALGLGMQVNGLCQTEQYPDVFRAQLEAGRLRAWPEFAQDFEQMDEVDVALQAMSMVEYLRRIGVGRRDLWYAADWRAIERMTGKTVAQLDSAWRANLRHAYTAIPIDRARWLKRGCQ
jgi:hypothetical protein